MKIPPLNIAKLFCCLLAIAMLSSCSIGYKSASSFSTRKYTKGYFFNRTGSGETVRNSNRRGVITENTNRKNNATGYSMKKVQWVTETYLNKDVVSNVTAGKKITRHNAVYNSFSRTSWKEKPFIVTGAIMLSAGINEDNKDYQTNIGLLGLILTLAGLIAEIALILPVAISTGLKYVAGVSLGYGIFIALLLALTGLIICLIVSNGNDKHPKLASAGSSIGLIAIGIFIIMLIYLHIV